MTLTLDDLEAQIVALQVQVNALPSATAEQSTPTYVTVNPDGTTSIQFNDAVFDDATINNATINTASTENLTIPEAPNSDFSAQNALGWLDTSGIMWGYVQGNEDSSTEHSVTLGIPAPAVGSLPDAAIVVGSGSRAGASSGVAIVLGLASLPDVFQQLDVYDDNGASDLFVVGTPGEISPPFSQSGTATLFWSGGSTFSNATNVPLRGASGTVMAVASPQGSVSGTASTPIIGCAPDGAGGVNFFGLTINTVPGGFASVEINYLMWGH